MRVFFYLTVSFIASVAGAICGIGGGVNIHVDYKAMEEDLSNIRKSASAIVEGFPEKVNVSVLEVDGQTMQEEVDAVLSNLKQITPYLEKLNKDASEVQKEYAERAVKAAGVMGGGN